VWIATPSLYDSFIHDTSAVLVAQGHEGHEAGTKKVNHKGHKGREARKADLFALIPIDFNWDRS